MISSLFLDYVMGFELNKIYIHNANFCDILLFELNVFSYF